VFDRVYVGKPAMELSEFSDALKLIVQEALVARPQGKV
jgi:hypothetical protein